MATKAKREARRQRRHDARRTVAEFDCRTFSVRAASVDEEGRSVEAYITTETPVPEFDYQRFEVVPRILLTSGVEMPESRQVPLLDSHGRWSTAEQLGSIRSIRAEAGGLVGRLHFSSVAEDDWTKVREGHITDVSAGFRVLAEEYVPAGKKATINGREFTGPVNVATKWRLLEGSITPIGADELAKLRGLDPATLRGTTEGTEAFKMHEQLRALCVERGMSADLTDEQAQEWLVENRAKVFAPVEPPAEKKAGEQKPEGERAVGGLTAADVERLLNEREQKRAAFRAAFRAEVKDLCELADVEARAEWYELGDLAAVRKAVADAKRERQEQVPGARISFAQNQPADRGRSAIGSALIARCLQETGCRQDSIDRVFPAGERDKNADDFRHATLLDMARTCLEWEGVDTRRMTRENIAIAALGFYEQAGVRAGGASIHVTSSFASLTKDAVNKSMMVGYVEYPATWRGPMRQGSSVPDFKQIHRLRLGAIPNLPVWPDNTDPEQASLKDAEEKYAVECYSLEIPFSYRLLVNDDMDSLSRVPSMYGAAAARTVNAVAWAQITGNPTMEDGQALFLESATGNRKQGNLLTTSSAVPNSAGLSPLRKLMRKMRGENTPEGAIGPNVLNLEPRYLVAPAALEQQVLETVRSASKPEAEMSSGVYNQWRTLMPIIEPLLDDSSEKAFYLFASPSQVDTVEVTFLQGQESPVPRSWTDVKTLSQHHAIVQTFAAKALNWRGIVKESGE